MISFASDYIEGAHPSILQRLIETNLDQQPGYSEDQYCASARDKIREACGCPQGDVFFLVGGTQTNSIVIASLLQPMEGAVSVETGHIAVHEAGAVESTGHKVLVLPHHHGKMDAEELKNALATFYANPTAEHMVYPGIVYISHPTEYGTLYTKDELTRISEICHAYHMPLFLDGARLGYALTSRETDVTLQDLGTLCDVFYIGGTKVGALCGEAVVFPHGNAPKHFRTFIKQHGAMLAKGRLLGIQFDTLFTDNLYTTLGQHANDMALELVKVFEKHHIPQLFPSPTNQQFMIMRQDQIQKLSEHVVFEFWEKYDDTHDVVRFVTSWATPIENIQKLDQYLTDL